MLKTLEVFVWTSFIKEISTELYFLNILLEWAGNVCDVAYSEELSTFQVMTWFKIPSKWKSCRSKVVAYFTHEGAHFHIWVTLCLFLRWYLKIGVFSLWRYVHFCVTLRTYFKKINQLGELKDRSMIITTVLTMKQ